LEYCNNSLFCGNFGKKDGFPEISLTETSAILYLLSMLEVNTADFNKRLIAAREVTGTKAPFDSQIYAIRIADAFIKSKTDNKSLVKMFIERLDTLSDEEKGKINLDEYARTKIKNAIAIYGSAGTGKTSVVAKLISAMNPDAKVFGTAMFEPQRIKLQESTGLDETQIIDAEALLNSVLPDRNKRDSNNYSVNATLVDRAAVLRSGVTLNLHSDLLTRTFDPKNNNIVIIDELTLFSSLD
jgi:Cdc6-like AAA superfamily ATPase